MQFVVFATDKPGSIELRKRTRPEHRSHLRNDAAHAVRVLLAGPTLDPSSAQMNGTLLVVEADSIDAVILFVDADPYSKVGLFEQVHIRPWSCGLGQIDPTVPDPARQAHQRP